VWVSVLEVQVLDSKVSKPLWWPKEEMVGSSNPAGKCNGHSTVVLVRMHQLQPHPPKDVTLSPATGCGRHELGCCLGHRGCSVPMLTDPGAGTSAPIQNNQSPFQEADIHKERCRQGCYLRSHSSKFQAWSLPNWSIFSNSKCSTTLRIQWVFLISSSKLARAALWICHWKNLNAPNYHQLRGKVS
jgi:hypothetical protein